jgi:H+/Cl- antiporter ClcA
MVQPTILEEACWSHFSLFWVVFMDRHLGYNSSRHVAFFAAAAKTTISSIIMGSEMTGGYTLLAPIMLATVIAYVASGQKNGIFRNQVSSRADLEQQSKSRS